MRRIRRIALLAVAVMGATAVMASGASATCLYAVNFFGMPVKTAPDAGGQVLEYKSPPQVVTGPCGVVINGYQEVYMANGGHGWMWSSELINYGHTS